MNKPTNKRAIIVGIFIMIGIVFLIGGILIIGNLHSTFQKKMTISTVFGNVSGLQSGNNIWFSGVKIGIVKKIEFYGESQVKVSMNINSESQQYIRKDAKVKISTDGLIGNKILVIYGGTAGAPPIEEGDTLANETMLSTEDILNTLQENNLNILVLTNKLARGEGTIGKLLNSDSIYDNIAATTHSLQFASENARALMVSLASFGAKLNTDGSLANDLVTDTVVFNSIKTTVAGLQRIADTASLFVNHLKTAGSNPDSPMGVLLNDEQSGASLKMTITNLETSTGKLDKVLDALQQSFLFKKYFRKEKQKSEN